MLDKRTHTIIYLEHHVKQQDLELGERAVTIAALKQQLQVPPALTTPAEPDIGWTDLLLF
jgi:hypothetical protein